MFWKRELQQLEAEGIQPEMYRILLENKLEALLGKEGSNKETGSDLIADMIKIILNWLPRLWRVIEKRVDLPLVQDCLKTCHETLGKTRKKDHWGWVLLLHRTKMLAIDPED